MLSSSYREKSISRFIKRLSCVSACDCDPTGSRDGVMCDPLTGQCICKENVDGQRCDRCKYGFFNLRAENPDGCQGKKYSERSRESCGLTLELSWQLYKICVTLIMCFQFLACRCHALGSIGSCDQWTGSCQCDHLASGPQCDRCVVGFMLELLSLY